jgi:hypothetical protein
MNGRHGAPAVHSARNHRGRHAANRHGPNHDENRPGYSSCAIIEQHI